MFRVGVAVAAAVVMVAIFRLSRGRALRQGSATSKPKRIENEKKRVYHAHDMCARLLQERIKKNAHVEGCRALQCLPQLRHLVGFLQPPEPAMVLLTLVAWRQLNT